MNKFAYILIPAIAALGAVSCGSDDDVLAPEKSKYIYDIPQTDLDRDAVVGAYYSNITSSSSWRKSGAAIYYGTPVLGEYLSADNGVMEQQLKWADEAGVDYLILGYNASEADDDLVAAFCRARTAANAKVRYVLDYSTKHLGISNDAPLESTEKLDAMKSDFAATIIPLFADDAYYKLEGKPVVMITPVNLSSSALTSVDFSLVMPAIRSVVGNAGYTLYAIGEIATGWVAPVNYEEHQLASFDALTVNDWSTNNYDRYYGFFSFIDLNWANWKSRLVPYGTEFIPCVFPSYSDRKNSSSSYKYEFGLNGVTSDYVNFCNVAKRNIGVSGMVIVNSWNNFQKGTNLEPSVENQSKFIEVTRRQFKK